MYHECLFSLAIELAALSNERTIYYKLHPHQFSQKTEILKIVGGNTNIVIVSDEMGFNELFSRCNYVVGVHSTMIYIALQAGKKVCLYKRATYFLHEDIFRYVERFDNLAELSKIFANSDGKYLKTIDSCPEFFQRFNVRRFNKILTYAESYL